MKISKLVIVVFPFCLSLMACNLIGGVSKAEYSHLQVELKKEEDLNQQLEEQYKEVVSQLEEMKGQNSEPNAIIDKQKNEIAKLKEELAKCKSTKKN